MRLRTISRSTILVGVLAIAVAASARPPFGARHEGDKHHQRFFEIHAERLDIDDQTADQIRQKFEASREQADPIRTQLHDAHTALGDLLKVSAPDPDAVMLQAERIGALEAEMRMLRLTTLLEVRGLLNEEQRTEMVAIHEERIHEAVQPMLGACAGDVDAYCPDIEDRRSLFRCMRENRHELSEPFPVEPLLEGVVPEGLQCMAALDVQSWNRMAQWLEEVQKLRLQVG